MKKLHHNWPRFWIPLGEPAPLDGLGYLYDPDNEYAHFYYTSYQPNHLSQLGATPIVILLGEPGIGKSTALQEESLRLQTEGETFLYRELNQYQSDTRLIEDIFGSEEIRTWRQGKHSLTLLLDSLDECSLTIPTATRILASQLKGLPKERLNLRLTCRTADWPTHYADELRELWRGRNKNSPDPLSIFELAPLRKIDIQCAARDHKLDADAFLEEVHQKELQPLASHPNTLNMLMSLFGRPDGLPRQRAELYRLGCETLAAERNPFRQESHLAGKLTARQRMAIAGRIAAQMIFGHRSTIWRGDSWDAETADLLESDITGGTELAEGLDFPVDSHALRETIECALFSGRGEKRIGFAHQSYTEFLAAWHIHSHAIGAQRALSLLCHPDDGRIPPQHAESGIWLAALDEAIFTSLVETEPLLLLRTDLSDTTDEQKAQLTGKLLSSFAARTEFDMDWGLRQHYRKLAYPGLSVQLHPYLTDKELSVSARRAAVDIASACHIRELTNDLITIALDQDEKFEQRQNAANAAADLADAQHLVQLLPLALGEAGEDPDDGLKAAVISSLWPKHITTEKIFELLSESQNVRCLGRFRYSPENFIEQFADDDLVVALKWLAKIGAIHQAYEVDHFKDVIMAEAWKRLDVSCVLSAFCDAVWACLDRFESIFNRRGEREKDWPKQDERRRKIAIMALLDKAHSTSDGKKPPLNLILWRNEFIFPQDTFWLLDRYQESSDGGLKTKLAECINFFVHWDSETAWLDAVINVACAEAPHAESPLSEAIAGCLEPIILDSEIAHTLKEQHDQQLAWKNKRPPPLSPPPPVRIEQALHEFEAGKKDAWMRLWQELSLPDEATCYRWSCDSITKSPGWQRATSLERARIMKCAETWVMAESLAQNDIFRPDNSISYLHSATYLALRLLSDENPQSIANAPTDKWHGWAEAIIAYPFDDESEQRRNLVTLAYSNAPKAVLETFRRLINKDIAAAQSLYSLRELVGIWDEKVAELLREFLAKPGLTPHQASTLLDALLEHGDETAFEFACNAIITSPPVGPPNQPLALAAANKLVARQIQRGWPILWDKMLADSVFGEKLILELAYHAGPKGNLVCGLTEQQIVELYFWLEEHFPTAMDVRYSSGEAHSVSARDEVGRLRDGCPSYLSSLGTRSSIDALHTISDRFPDRDWLKHLHNEAKQAFRKATLQPLAPAELIAYTHHENARLARSSIELMAAVLVSLQNLQKKLHGQTLLAPFLWDLSDNGKSGRPKSEDRLSDFIKHHLENDLPAFVIDREVQIRNLKEHGIGERTDLKIEAKDQEGRSAAVIIESKGCWNKELMTAMHSQLSNRYLRLADGACGIYLVGWFRCERLDDKTDCVFKGTKEELIAELSAQAQALSTGDGNVSSFVLDATY